MSQNKSVRCYDYVNHPYLAVVDALKKNPNDIFRNATKSAADRASGVAGELHVKIAGMEIGKDIDITIQRIEDMPKELGSPPKTRIDFEWVAAKNPALYPKMQGNLDIYPLTSTETQLDLFGTYQVPLGLLGEAVDSFVGHGIAEASLHRFIKDVAAHLRSQLASDAVQDKSFPTEGME